MANQIRFPIGVRVLPGDKQLLVVNSNFDLQFNTATVAVVDLATNALDPRQTVRINSFPGDIVLRADGKRAYVASRTEGVLTTLDIDATKTPMLHCTDTPVAKGDLPRCDGDWVVTVPGNPFGIYVDSGNPRAPVGGCGTIVEDRENRETLILTHLNTATTGTTSTGIVSVYEAVEGALPFNLKTTFGDVPAGLNAIVPNPTTGTLWITSRFDASIALLRYVNGGLFKEGLVVATGARSGLDNRGVAFKPDGTRAYVVYHAVQSTTGASDPMLAVYDTSCSPDGIETHQLAEVVDLCLDPGVPYYYASPGQPDRLLVPCSTSKEIYVFDAELLELERIVEVGDGAYFMDFTAGARTGTGLQRGYVTNFREDSISIIDLDPKSPNYFREIGRIRDNMRVLP